MSRNLPIALLLSVVAMLAAADPVILETQTFRLEVGPEGLVQHFADKTAGADYADTATPAPFAQITLGGKPIPAASAALGADGLALTFAGTPGRVLLRVTPAEQSLVLEVVSVEGLPAVEELMFLSVPLTLKGDLTEPFAACALALNLLTNVPETPGPSKLLRASCCAKFGLVGAAAAIVAAPQAGLRDALKQAVSAAPDVPRSNIGGPWALDADINRGSYLFDFGDLNEKNVDAWIECVRSLGLNQIDFHTGSSLRFGDLRPNPKLFPNGRASVKAVLDKLHAAGINAGLHTYAFFMSKETPYVTPVPDKRLGKHGVYTLAADITAEADALPVDESTANVSTITGFFVRNSVTLHVDDELITFTGVTKEAPFTFTGCQRGALGTKAAPHAKGASIGHIKECFGLFAPDADSTLLTEVAQNTADTFNECGFDMIYLDALDGEDILGGAQYSWHYGSKFVWEIAKRLNKPALFEMSTFHHHLWYVRARMGAWDHPTRAHKRFIDVHCAANQSGAGLYLPMNLGWWSVKTAGEGEFAMQNEPTYADDIEYLMGKCIGNGMGLSLMGVNPTTIKSVPAYQRLAPIFRQYEELRHAKYFSEDVKAKLRVPGDEFTLQQAADGRWQFRQARYDKHKAVTASGAAAAWTSRNPYAAQPLRLRIEALHGVQPYDSAAGVVLEDFANPAAYASRDTQPEVTFDMAAAAGDDMPMATVTAANKQAPPNGAWGRITRHFEPPLDLGDKQGLGVWIEGDGSGALINFQLKSPEHTVHGGNGDHYAVLDFTGRRYFELLEPEGENIIKYAWPYAGSAYANYREYTDYKQIQTLSIWCNLLPQGKPVTCRIGAVKALPIAKITLKNPSVTVGGATVTFPAEIPTGGYLELTGDDACALYGPKGELIASVKPEGKIPTLEPGENEIQFNAQTNENLNARALVTLITFGDTI